MKSFIYSNVFTVKKKWKPYGSTLHDSYDQHMQISHQSKTYSQNKTAVMTLIWHYFVRNWVQIIRRCKKSFVKMICKHRVIKETVFTHFSNRGQESNSTSRSIHQNCYQNANELASMTFLLSVHIKSRSSRQIIMKVPSVQIIF